jgi:hypothetical protein
MKQESTWPDTRHRSSSNPLQAVPHDCNVELAIMAAHNAGGAKESHRVAQNLIIGRLSGKPGIGERMAVTVL